MGLVKISEPMHENLRVVSAALSRSINAQAEHWLRIGMMAELHPELRYGELCRLLIEDELRTPAAAPAMVPEQVPGQVPGQVPSSATVLGLVSPRQVRA